MSPEPIPRAGLRILGATDAVACEGDACLIPAAAATPAASPSSADERDEAAVR